MRSKTTAKISAAAAAAAAILMGGAHAAEPAGNFFDTYLANVQNGTSCYGRTYDDAHLKAHGEQKVRRIEIDMGKSNTPERENTAESFELGIAVMTRSSTEWYGQVALCKAAATSADCSLEGDGGLFTLTPANDGALRLETGSYGISFEGEKDFLELSATTGDDRVFILKPGREECDAAGAHFKADQE